MEKRSIGQFLSTLRRAHGYTQQEVADMLGISNKTLSSWETDKTYPDIVLIPALAELYGVTCDEIIKGCRIKGDERAAESEEPSPRAIAPILNKLREKNKLRINLLRNIAICCSVLIGISYFVFRLGELIGLIFLAISVCCLISCIIAIKYTYDSTLSQANNKNDDAVYFNFYKQNYLVYSKALFAIILTCAISLALAFYILIISSTIYTSTLLYLLCSTALLFAILIYTLYLIREKKLKNVLKDTLNGTYYGGNYKRTKKYFLIQATSSVALAILFIVCAQLPRILIYPQESLYTTGDFSEFKRTLQTVTVQSGFDDTPRSYTLEFTAEQMETFNNEGTLTYQVNDNLKFVIRATVPFSNIDDFNGVKYAYTTTYSNSNGKETFSIYGGVVQLADYKFFVINNSIGLNTFVSGYTKLTYKDGEYSVRNGYNLNEYILLALQLIALTSQIVIVAVYIIGKPQEK